MRLFSRENPEKNKEIEHMFKVHEKQMEVIFDYIDKMLRDLSFTSNSLKVLELNKALFKIKYLRAETLKKLRSYTK